MDNETTDNSAEESQAPGPTGGNDQWCAVCEIAVPRGYLKCPKCKQRMPAARRKAAAGGTSMVVVAGARRPFWLLLGLGITAAAAIYFHLSITDTYNSIIRRRPTETAPGDGGTGAAADAGEDAGPAATEEQRDEALNALVGILEAANIEADVEVSAGAPDTVILRSAQCREPALADSVAEATSDLSSANFAKLQCYAPNGTVMLTKSW